MEIKELIYTLLSQGKDTLANVIKNSGDLTIAQYSKYLWSYNTDIPFEPELIKAFKTEFKRVGVNENIWDEIINSMQKYRTIQTASHTGLLDSTSVPSLTLHSIALKSIPLDVYYIVGTFSGIPFGNDSYPAVLSCNINRDFKDVIDENSIYYPIFKKRQLDRIRDVKDEKYNRLSLYENNQRDELVYRSKIPESFKKIYPYLTGPVKDYLKYKDGDTDFTKLMVNSTNEFSKKLFNNEKIIYIDINEVVSNYLCLVLNNKDHFIYKMFFEEIFHKQIMDVWREYAHFFYDVIDSQNGKKQVKAYIDELILKNTISEERVTPEKLIEKLKNTQFCPGVFMGFTVLSFLNGFQCFGSFKQTTYLTDYKNTWVKSNLLPIDITNVRTNSLTTGELPNEENRYKTAIDIALGSIWQGPDDNMKFNDIILPMQNRLIGFKR